MSFDDDQEMDFIPRLQRGLEPESPLDDVSTRRSEDSEPARDEASYWKDKFARLYADLDSTKRLLARQSADEVEAAKKTILRDVLPVADGLDLALAHTTPNEDQRSIIEGIELVQNMLDTFLRKHGVQAIEALGKPFDPNLHEALGMVRDPRVPPDTVVRVEQKGYLYGDSLLRPAQVFVNRV